MSQPKIAAVCGCGQATISDLASGKTQEPRHSLGQNLIALLDRVKAEAEAEPAPAVVTPEPTAAAQG